MHRQAILLVALAASACVQSVATVPEIVDLTGLEARLHPTQSEKALLVNFWATW